MTADERIRRGDPEAIKEIVVLARKLDTHLTEYALHKLDVEARFALNEAAHTKNMEAIAALTAATRGVVDAWTTANNLQRFIKWVSAFAIVMLAAQWLHEKFPILFTR